MRLPVSQFEDPNLLLLAENTPPGRRRRPVPQEGDLDHLLDNDETVQQVRRDLAEQPEPEPAAQPEPEPLPPENQAIADEAIAQINAPPPQDQIAADAQKAVAANAGPAAIEQPKLSTELPPDRALPDKASSAVLEQKDVQVAPQLQTPPTPPVEPSPAAKIMDGTATGPAPEPPKSAEPPPPGPAAATPPPPAAAIPPPAASPAPPAPPPGPAAATAATAPAAETAEPPPPAAATAPAAETAEPPPPPETPPETVPQAVEQGAEVEQTETEAPASFKSETLATAPAGESKLVTKSPQWYDFDQPPEYTGNEAAILALVAGIIQAGIAPNKKIALAMLAGGAFDAATAKLAAPMQDYKNRLDSAGKQAQMTATLKASQGGRDQDTLAREKFEYQKKQDQDEAHYEAQTKIRGTPESDEMADSYIAGGYYPPEAKETLSGWQMKMGRVGAGQQAAQGRQFQNQNEQREKRYLEFLSKYNLQNSEHNRRFFMEQEAKMQGEERDRVADVEKMEIPGLKYTGRRALPPEILNDAIKIKSAMDTIEQNGRELAELQKKVSDPLSQRTGGWLRLFPNGEDQKAILARMQNLQQEAAAAQRVVWNQGVPQKYELLANEKTNPNAKDPWAFFRGVYDWKALSEGARKTGLRKLRDRRYIVNDGKPTAVGAASGDDTPLDPSSFYIGSFLVNGKHKRELTQKGYDDLKASGYTMVPAED